MKGGWCLLTDAVVNVASVMVSQSRPLEKGKPRAFYSLMQVWSEILSFKG